MLAERCLYTQALQDTHTFSQRFCCKEELLDAAAFPHLCIDVFTQAYFLMISDSGHALRAARVQQANMKPQFHCNFLAIEARFLGKGWPSKSPHFVNVHLMICNRFGIRAGLVEDSVFVSLKIALKISWQSIWPHPLPQKRIVKKSLKFRPRSRCFNSSLMKFQRKFERNFDDISLWQNVVANRFATRQHFVKTREGTIFFLVAKRCATTFCHTKKSLKFRQRFRCFNSSSRDFLTNSWWNYDERICGKILWQNVLPQSTRPKV